MGIGTGIGNSIPRGITGNAGIPTPFFEIIAENGDFLLAEDGKNPTFLITERQ